MDMMSRRAFKGVQIEGSSDFMVLLMYVCSNKMGVSMQLSVTMVTAEPLCAYRV